MGVFEVPSSKRNPEKLANLTREVPNSLARIQSSLDDIEELVIGVNKELQQLATLLEDNKLVNARGIADLDREMRLACVDLLASEEFDLLESRLSDAQSATDEVVEYYEERYLPTIERTTNKYG